MNGYQEQKILKSVLNAKQEIGCKGRTWTMNKPKKNKRIKCACGCGKHRWRYNKWGNKRRYIEGHQSRKNRKNKLIKCVCGCNQTLLQYDKQWRKKKFIYGHSQKGREHSEETKKQISKAHIGMKVSKETRKKMSLSHTGMKLTKGAKEKISKAHIGVKVSKKTRRKISNTRKELYKQGKLIPYYLNKTFSKEHKENLKKANLGKKLSKEHRKKISEGGKGLKRSKETRRRISEANKLEKNSMWKGGLSFEPYGIEFNNQLKEQIRKRDKQCQLCNKKKNRRKFCVHHIDYNKKNNNPKNLITLCDKCHSITNSNREFWITFFKKKMRKR